MRRWGTEPQPRMGLSGRLSARTTSLSDISMQNDIQARPAGLRHSRADDRRIFGHLTASTLLAVNLQQRPRRSSDDGDSLGYDRRPDCCAGRNSSEHLPGNLRRFRSADALHVCLYRGHEQGEVIRLLPVSRIGAWSAWDGDPVAKANACLTPLLTDRDAHE
ncbi:hypothetical protein BV20DRAFT_695249 [Pilatotrama ljubarskyi]|nr:hypothetical protein BV20DRAFT_695249 [Pilatotrama ljubarskyi]